VRLSLQIALGKWLNVAFSIRYWEKWIIFRFLKTECVFHYCLTDIHIVVLELFFKGSPFFLIIFTCKPYLIVSEHFIKRNLLAKGLHKCFYRIIDLLFLSFLVIPILWYLTLIYVIFQLLALKALVCVWSFSIELFIIILTLGRSIRNGDIFLLIVNSIKWEILIKGWRFLLNILMSDIDVSFISIYITESSWRIR
jgi:hypothetical protein